MAVDIAPVPGMPWQRRLRIPISLSAMKMFRLTSLLQPSRDAAAKQIQHAALPYVETGGSVLVCLITSRGSGRWVIPKGWPKPGLAPHELAELEAAQEAGLQGRISTSRLGSFDYAKRLHAFSSVICSVDVYPLEVRKQLLDWPERHSRHLGWMDPARAAKLVEEPELASLIGSFKPPQRS